MRKVCSVEMCIRDRTYPAAVEKFATVGRILNPELSGLSDEEAAKRCCEEVDQLLKDIGMWLNFESFSVDEATIRRIADRSHDLPDYKACLLYTSFLPKDFNP